MPLLTANERALPWKEKQQLRRLRRLENRKQNRADRGLSTEKIQGRQNTIANVGTKAQRRDTVQDLMMKGYTWGQARYLAGIGYNPLFMGNKGRELRELNKAQLAKGEKGVPTEYGASAIGQAGDKENVLSGITGVQMGTPAETPYSPQTSLEEDPAETQLWAQWLAAIQKMQGSQQPGQATGEAPGLSNYTSQMQDLLQQFGGKPGQTTPTGLKTSKADYLKGKL